MTECAVVCATEDVSTGYYHYCAECPLRQAPRGLGQPPQNRSCSLTGCSNKHRAKGWCDKHYRRWLHYGDPQGGPGQGKGARPGRRAPVEQDTH